MRTRYLLVTMLAAQLLVAVQATAAKKKPAPPPDPLAAEQITVIEGALKMPSGFDPRFMQLIDEARLMRVYTQIRGIEDAADSKLLFNRQAAEKLDLTNAQVNSQFASMIKSSRRFQVFDDSTTVVREQAIQSFDGKTMDIVIEGMVQRSYQEPLPVGPYRKVRTNIKLAVTVKDVPTGEDLIAGGIAEEGDYGSTQGEGALLPQSASMDSPEMQSSMAADYHRALDKALAKVVERINKLLRPMARVSFVSDTAVGVIGGSAHGFQSDDQLVVFRPQYGDVNGKRKVVFTQPLAVIRCGGVGTESSQCDITHVDKRYTVAVGDFAVLSDVSAKGVREK
jgi:hypothetical protein